MSRLPIASLVALTCCLTFAAPSLAADSDETSALDLFEQRIMPIFKSPNPSSCVQCHLSSVDLKDYILPSHEKTFLSLRDQGLIDLEAPEKSKILKLIGMGKKDPDEGARLIHKKTRQAEYEAFAAWIKASANMLWVPLRPKAAGQKGNERGNPYLAVDEVLSIWRDSVPAEARRGWAHVDPTPADRLADTVQLSHLRPPVIAPVAKPAIATTDATAGATAEGGGADKSSDSTAGGGGGE
ncbi:MAG: hypothetical protein QGG36_22515 [Pirellulaceae bacterium]|jgi:hypothetical protein|nr:hypothetical protein [Pirellulaceae bacterium]MDP7018589.1 hypothetical protein [Pirellulaceae bacterium]